MQEQTQQQLLSELELRHDEAKSDMNKSVTERDKQYYIGVMHANRDAIQLIKSITTNRSSQEPKIKE